MGFGFASFLLGDYASVTQTPSEFTREGSQEWGLFAQDSWKVTRKLTVTYGARWDYATPEHEQYGRMGQLDPTLPNPSAGGALGAVQFANTCNCNFYKSAYPFAIGPRVGAAYQLNAQNRDSRRLGIHLSVRCVPSRRHDRHSRHLPSVRSQSLCKHRDSGCNWDSHLAKYLCGRIASPRNRREPGCSWNDGSLRPRSERKPAAPHQPI